MSESGKWKQRIIWNNMKENQAEMAAAVSVKKIECAAINEKPKSSANGNIEHLENGGGEKIKA